jgi:hypothetical protein
MVRALEPCRALKLLVQSLATLSGRYLCLLSVATTLITFT